MAYWHMSLTFLRERTTNEYAAEGDSSKRVLNQSVYSTIHNGWFSVMCGVRDDQSSGYSMVLFLGRNIQN